MNNPTGLPGAKPPDLDRAERDHKKRLTCTTCGNEGRLVSNYSGVNIHCNYCKTHWPVSSTPRGGVIGSTLGDGF